MFHPIPTVSVPLPSPNSLSSSPLGWVAARNEWLRVLLNERVCVCVLSSFDVQDIYLLSAAAILVIISTHEMTKCTLTRQPDENGASNRSARKMSISCNGKLPAAIHSRHWLHPIVHCCLHRLRHAQIFVYEKWGKLHTEDCVMTNFWFFFFFILFLVLLCLAWSTCTSCTQHTEQ